MELNEHIKATIKALEDKITELAEWQAEVLQGGDEWAFLEDEKCNVWETIEHLKELV